MPDNCPHCGVALAWATRACPQCGARLPDPVSPVLGDPRPDGGTGEAEAKTWAERWDVGSWADDATVAVGAETAGAGPDAGRVGSGPATVGLGPRGWWAQSRHRNLVAIAVCGVVLGVAVGVAFAIGNQAVEPNRVVPAKPVARQHARRLGGVTPTAPAISPELVREFTYVNQLEAVLQQAAPGRAVLAGTLRGAPASCPMPPGQAAVVVNAVLQNRTNLLNALGAMAPAPNAEAQQLEQLLAAALHASSQADGEYEAWLAANGVTDPASCSATSSPAIAVFWNSARASDSTATTAKAAFVAAFDPVAARFNLPVWNESQF